LAAWVVKELDLAMGLHHQCSSCVWYQFRCLGWIGFQHAATNPTPLC